MEMNLRIFKSASAGHVSQFVERRAVLGCDASPVGLKCRNGKRMKKLVLVTALALASLPVMAQITVDPTTITSGVESGFNTGGGIGLAMLGVAMVVGVIVFGLNLRKRR